MDLDLDLECEWTSEQAELAALGHSSLLSTIHSALCSLQFTGVVKAHYWLLKSVKSDSSTDTKQSMWAERKRSKAGRKVSSEVQWSAVRKKRVESVEHGLGLQSGNGLVS